MVAAQRLGLLGNRFINASIISNLYMELVLQLVLSSRHQLKVGLFGLGSRIQMTGTLYF